MVENVIARQFVALRSALARARLRHFWFSNRFCVSADQHGAIV